MIRKLVRQMLAAQVFSALTVSLCLLIDNVMISRFLGETGMAAYSLANPVLLAIGAVGSLLAAGVQVACSKSLGRGSQEEPNAGFSSAVALGGVISILFAVAVVVFRSPLASAMGAGQQGELFEQTRDYLAGFCIGAPGSMGALVLVPFMQMAGQSTLLILAVLGMTVTDVALDLLNVLVFHGGMFGMGLASSISYYVAMAVAAVYFLSRRSVFRFSRKLVTGRKMSELFSGGVPAGFNMASSVILVYAMNRILQGTGGETAVAAYAAITGIGHAANCITTGIGGVSLTLSGILFNEEDRNGLKELTGRLCKYGVVLGLGMGVLLVVFAPAFISLFIPEAGIMKEMAIIGLRLFAAGLVPCCINNALKYMYQGTGKIALTEIISVAEGAVFPALAALILSRLFGTTGAWLFFAVGEVITLLGIGLLIRRKTGKQPWKDGAFLLEEKNAGVPEHLLETEIRTLEQTQAFVQAAEQFCRTLGEDAATANHIALCIEEIAVNVVQHGFTADEKPHHLAVRLLGKEDAWILRFRDDCTAFDPVHYVPAGEGEAIGLRLVLAIAEKAFYTYSLNMNNLTLRLRKGSAGEG